MATFTATDEDGDDIEWAVDGVDKGAFEIGEDTGVLTFKDAPNFEAKADADEDDDSLGNQGKGDNIYRVTVKANAASHAVAVTVDNVNEDGSVDLRPASAAGYQEPQGRPSPTRTATDMPTWQWAMGPTDEGPWTDIDGRDDVGPQAGRWRSWQLPAARRLPTPTASASRRPPA